MVAGCVGGECETAVVRSAGLDDVVASSQFLYTSYKRCIVQYVGEKKNMCVQTYVDFDKNTQCLVLQILRLFLIPLQRLVMTYFRRKFADTSLVHIRVSSRMGRVRTFDNCVWRYLFQEASLFVRVKIKVKGVAGRGE